MVPFVGSLVIAILYVIRSPLLFVPVAFIKINFSKPNVDQVPVIRLLPGSLPPVRVPLF